MGKVQEIDTHTFPIVRVLFSHQISILWCTSSYGKCRGFLINFSQYEKIQQYPFYGVTVEIGTHTFPIVWVIFPYTIPILRYTSSYGKCMGFPINFPQYRKMQQNSWYEPGKLVLILFSYYGRFFSIRFPFYDILHHMKNACVFSLLSHNMEKDSQTYRMEKVWEIGSRKYPTKPIVCGEPGKLVLIPFPWYGCFLSLDSYSVVYFIIREMFGFPRQFPIGWENAVKSIELGEPR